MATNTTLTATERAAFQAWCEQEMDMIKRGSVNENFPPTTGGDRSVFDILKLMCYGLSTTKGLTGDKTDVTGITIATTT